MSATISRRFIDEHVPVSLVLRYYATQIPQVSHHSAAGFAAAVAPFALGPNVACERNRFDAHGRRKSSPRSAAIDRHGLLTVRRAWRLTIAAPHAELARKRFFPKRSRVLRATFRDKFFRNRTDLRTWFIQNFLPRTTTFNNVQVLQQDANDNIVTNYVASRAITARDENLGLGNVKVVHYDHAETLTKADFSFAQDRALERNSVPAGQRK
jgi:lipopolysaccharide export LptBFGC system permease protein LptF